MRSRYLRLIALAALGLALAVAVPAAATPLRTTTFLGSVGSCTTSAGALVAVDFGHWGGAAVRGCDPNPTTGTALLSAAGFTTVGTQHDGPRFICRIGHALNDGGTQYPTPVQDPCVQTPPTSAYWNYWLAAKGSNTWRYSPVGAYLDQPKAGEVEVWTFGSTDVAGSSGSPAFTPNQVRAGLPAGPTVRAAVRPTARATPRVGPAADYLVGQLVDADHFESFPGFVDIGLTIDGAFALESLGTHDDDTHDDNLARIVAYVAEHQNDYTFLSGEFADFASGGAVGKVALLAETVGADPRAFGCADLIAALDRLVCTARTSDGACAAGGDYRYANSTFAQALALVAQLRAGDTRRAGNPTRFLESLQLPSGAFPSVLPGHDSDTDSTAMAAMALALVPTGRARAEVGASLAWLAARQEADGGFPGAAGDSVNSAAVALQALRLDAGTYRGEIAKGETFLAAEQGPGGGFYVAAGSESSGVDVRASAQALGGAEGTPFGSLLDDLPAKAEAHAGADFLTARLVDGSHYTSTSDGRTADDPATTADGVFALLAAGGHGPDVDKMVTYLKGHVEAYADPAGRYGGPYSGPLAELALVAEATGSDPRSFGGADLLATLASDVCAAAITGDRSGCTARGDFRNASSTVSQALGVLALQAAPNAAAHLRIGSPPVVRLHQRQCSDGGFSSTLLAAGATCTSDVSATAYAVQALAAVPGSDTWLGAAQAYLEQAQQPSGLFPGGAGGAKSTAVAAQALQTLVGALSAPTADPPQPRTVTPVLAWQSALAGLRSLAVSSGGFGNTASGPPDLRASTLAVVAAAQRTLLGLSGASVRSLPRVAAAPPGGGSSSDSPTGGAPSIGGNSGAAPAGGVIADTGAPALAQVLWALALVAGGGLLLCSGRRRMVAARHAAGGKRRF